jgi:hypothetical protein
MGQQTLRNLDALVGDAKVEWVDKNPPVKLLVDGYDAVADAAGARSPLLGAMVRTVPAAVGMLASPGGTRFAQGLGDRALTQAAGTLADTANAFRTTRSGAGMSVAERQAMNDMTQGVYDAMRQSGYSNADLRPACRWRSTCLPASCEWD